MGKYSDDPEYHRKKALEYYYNNKELCAEKAKAWRDKNKEYIRNKQREDKRLRKLKAVEYMGGKCNLCGNDYHPSVFEFHHLDPEIKDRDPSKMLQLSWDRLQAELDKCVLLCANCHRFTHYKDTY